VKKRTSETVVQFIFFVLLALSIIFILFNEGCSASAEQLRTVPYERWSAENCMSIIMANVSHNLRSDGQIVYALVIPYTPQVVKAIGRYRQLKYGLSDSLAYEFVQRLMQHGSSTFLDRQGAMWDARGNRFTGKRDSLMVLVSLINQTWPCKSPTLNGVPLIRQSDMPCEMPGISDIERHIFLRTDIGDTLYPSKVWGRKHESLTTDEDLLVVFDLRETEHQENLFLHIDAFDDLNDKTMIYGVSNE
jgi:hypothetical protein